MAVIATIASSIIGLQAAYSIPLMFIAIYAGIKLSGQMAKLTIITAAIALGWNSTALSGEDYDLVDLGINAVLAYGVVEVF